MVSTQYRRLLCGMVALLLTLLFSLQSLHAADNAKPPEPLDVDILVPPSVLEDLPDFLMGDDIFSIRDFNRPNSRRDVVDYVLLRQALALGARGPMSVKLTPWHSISYDRVLISLSRGIATVLSNTLWREDVGPSHPDLYVSSPTMAVGEYVAGMYMNPENPKYGTVKSREDIQSLNAVSSRQFVPDWRALEQLQLASLYSEVNWENMVRMVYRQRVDFMLIPFSREPDLSHTVMGMTLMPLPGFKVALDGSRGWVVSRRHPAGERTRNALERGMSILHQRGIIARAYREAGLINPAVDDWPLANPQQQAPASEH